MPKSKATSTIDHRMTSPTALNQKDTAGFLKSSNPIIA